MLTNLMQGFLDLSTTAMDVLGDGLGGLLVSPFQRFLDVTVNNQVLGMLNWIFPMAEAVALLQLWCSCIVVYYLLMFFKKLSAKQNLLG